MRKVLLLSLVAVSVIGLTKAKEETGPAAEEVKKEILKIEQDKLLSLRQNGPASADWFHRYCEPDSIMTSENGRIETKAEHEARLRTKQVAIVSMNQYDHRIRVFQNGTVAVVTYRQMGQLEGQDHPIEGVATDVWVKEAEGWQRIVHNTHAVVKGK